MNLSDKFTSSYSVSIFVHSPDGDIITPEAMADVLRLEKTLYNASLIQENLREKSQSDIFSMADMIANIVITEALMDAINTTIENTRPATCMLPYHPGHLSYHRGLWSS